MDHTVYLISSEVGNKILYKIGRTKRKVYERINDFRTGNASDFNILYEFKSKWGTKVERDLHKYFKEKKVNGEWFELTLEDLYLFADKCKMFHNNYEIIKNENTWIAEKGKNYL